VVVDVVAAQMKTRRKRQKKSLWFLASTATRFSLNHRHFVLIAAQEGRRKFKNKKTLQNIGEILK
jgi:hypothetical protein